MLQFVVDLLLCVSIESPFVSMYGMTDLMFLIPCFFFLFVESASYIRQLEQKILRLEEERKQLAQVGNFASKKSLGLYVLWHIKKNLHFSGDFGNGSFYTLTFIEYVPIQFTFKRKCCNGHMKFDLSLFFLLFFLLTQPSLASGFPTLCMLDSEVFVQFFRNSCQRDYQVIWIQACSVDLTPHFPIHPQRVERNGADGYRPADYDGQLSHRMDTAPDLSQVCIGTLSFDTLCMWCYLCAVLCPFWSMIVGWTAWPLSFVKMFELQDQEM